MNPEIPDRKELGPFAQILHLIGFAILGAIVFTLLAGVIIYFLYGSSSAISLGSITNGSPKNIDALKILQIFSSIGMFIFPPILLAYYIRRKPKDLFGLYQPKAMLLGITLLIMIASMPLMEWSAVWNQKMVLPEFLKGVERWMRAQEDATAKLTIELLTVRSVWDFGVNLIMIAVLPAIGEELMFRGGLQKAISKMFANPHVAIWLTAIIFSAIHMQFYGFIPRMLLGAGFGYLYFYSGNLWYAIVGHFLNNGFAVCATYYMQLHHIPLEKADEPVGFGWYGYLLSAIITIALFTYFKYNTSGRKLG